ncbi:MAG: hypothetical protein AAF587_15770 [Bacteroidota bacterium]
MKNLFFIGLALMCLSALTSCMSPVEQAAEAPGPDLVIEPIGNSLSLSYFRELDGTLIENPPGYTFAYPNIVGKPGIKGYVFTPEQGERMEIYCYDSDIDPTSPIQALLVNCDKQLSTVEHGGTSVTTCDGAGEECYGVSGGGATYIVTCSCDN